MGRGVVDVFSRTVIDVVDKKISPLELCRPAELVVLPVLPVKPALLIPSSSAHNTTRSHVLGLCNDVVTINVLSKANDVSQNVSLDQ